MRKESLELTSLEKQYEGSCGKYVTITANGKTTQAKVVDLVSHLSISPPLPTASLTLTF